VAVEDRAAERNIAAEYVRARHIAKHFIENFRAWLIEVRGWDAQRDKQHLDRKARVLAERLAWDLLTVSRRNQAEVILRTNRALDVQREQLAALMREPDRWAARIRDVEAAISVNEQIVHEAEKSIANVQDIANAVLFALLKPTSEKVYSRYRKPSQSVRFDLYVREVLVDFERIIGRRATPRGPFLKFLQDRLAAHAETEEIKWPIYVDPTANRAALEQRIRRILYRPSDYGEGRARPGSTRKRLKKRQKTTIRGKAGL
jgi:hypothetical protein